jgi:hypothetical protein
MISTLVFITWASAFWEDWLLAECDSPESGMMGDPKAEGELEVEVQQK